MTTSQPLKKDSRNAIPVLGVHGGSSNELAQALQVMGVHSGEVIDPAFTPHDDTDILERLSIVCFNDDLFRQVGKTWDGFEPLTETDFHRLLTSTALSEARSLLLKIQAKSSLWGIFDPRVTRLLPFWVEAFAQANIPIQPILALSDPRTAVQSLTKLYHWHPQRAVVLWLDHMISALLSCDLSRVVLIADDALEHRAHHYLPLLADTLDLELDEQVLQKWLDRLDARRNLVQTSLTPEDHLNSEEVTDGLMQFALEIYETLQKLGHDGTRMSALRQMGLIEQWRQAFERCRPLLNQIDSFSAQASKLKRTLHWVRIERTLLRQTIGRLEMQLGQMISLQSDLTQEKQKTEACLERIEDLKRQIQANDQLICIMTESRSWKLTAPLRWFRRMASNMFGH